MESGKLSRQALSFACLRGFDFGTRFLFAVERYGNGFNLFLDLKHNNKYILVGVEIKNARAVITACTLESVR